MAHSQKKINFDALKTTILEWLKERIADDGFEWIQAKSNQLTEGAEDWEFFSSFSAVPRYTEKEPLALSDDELQQAQALRDGWEPNKWTTDQLGRTLLILSIANYEKDEFLDKLEKTFISSDTGEAVALYQSLPLLPHPEALRKRAAEGIRTNITSIFNAVAHRNPYPADFMDEGAWNQIVLKALFIETPLYLIRGIDERGNQKLAEILIDYAHERWAAGREISPELWRPIGSYATEAMITDMEKGLNHPDEVQQQAALLALSASSLPQAQQLVAKHEELLTAMKKNNVTWDQIGRRVDNG